MADSLSQRIMRAALNNKGLKLAAVLLALVSWYVIHANISHERLLRDVPVTIRTDEGWAVRDAPVKNVNIQFRGSLDDLRLLEQAPVRVEVDARKMSSGLRQVRLTAAQVQAAGAARPVYLDPPSLMFVLDQQSEKWVPVEADFQGSPLQEYEKTRVICEPAQVLLHGPLRRLQEIEAVHTLPIDLEARSRPFRKTHVALALSSETWLANGTASNVNVDVTIEERVATRMFQDVPVNALLAVGTRGEIMMRPAQVNLTLRGRSELLGHVRHEDLRAYVDGTALVPGAAATLPVQVFLPNGLEIAAIEPANLKVQLK